MKRYWDNENVIARRPKADEASEIRFLTEFILRLAKGFGMTLSDGIASADEACCEPKGVAVSLAMTNERGARNDKVGKMWGINPHAAAWCDAEVAVGWAPPTKKDMGWWAMPTLHRGLADERGTALVIAMIFLGLLTTIGIYSLLSSSTELTSSARYKSNKEAFYAAEGAIEYIKGDGYYFTTKGTMDFPDRFFTDRTPDIAHPTPAARDLSSEGTDASGTIEYITSGNPPPGYGFSAKDTMSGYFVIEATGTSRAGVQNEQEESVARILPKG